MQHAVSEIALDSKRLAASMQLLNEHSLSHALQYPEYVSYYRAGGCIHVSRQAFGADPGVFDWVVFLCAVGTAGGSFNDVN